jgi:DNA-binding NarL/FixJ family response regulator
MRENVHVVVAASLARAREAYAGRSWLDAETAFSRADEEGALAAGDLELWATTRLMLGEDERAVAMLERAHDLHLEMGDPIAAVRAAAWIGMNLAYTGAVGPAGGWLARAQRLLDQEAVECAEAGYLLLPRVFRHEAAGEYEDAARVAGEAASLGMRFGDPDLLALALHSQGHILVLAGQVRDGLALLDEAMVMATKGDLHPFVLGIVYCGVILACQSVFEVGRAREWTQALAEWVAGQAGLVAFTGRCLIHRAELFQLGGAWPDALHEARLAEERLEETRNPAAGVAHYREAELLRLVGDFAAAERAYRVASRLGWEPQPGLAQLRLAQGRTDAALASIRRARGEVAETLKQAALLPAHVEIALAAAQRDEARAAAAELRDLAGRYESPMLAAMVAYADGAVALADGDAGGALSRLREAQRSWQDLDAPYEVARSRALAAQACAALADAEAAALDRDAAAEIFRRLGAVPDLARIRPATLGDIHGLTGRELEVLRLVARGATNRQIAEALVISEHTVARHVQNIYGKLRLGSRAAATAFAFEHDLV